MDQVQKIYHTQYSIQNGSLQEIEEKQRIENRTQIEIKY